MTISNNPPPHKLALLRQVLHLKKLNAIQKCIAFEIILASHEDLSSSFPGAQRLAAAASVAKRDTVFAALNRLEEIGITRIKRPNGQSNEYEINWVRIEEQAQREREITEAVENMRASRTRPAPGGVPSEGASRQTGRVEGQTRPAGGDATPEGTPREEGRPPSRREGRDPSRQMGHYPSLTLPIPSGNQPPAERANLFDDGSPGAHVNGTAIHVRYPDGKTITIQKVDIHRQGKALGLTIAESEDVAQEAFSGWVTDGWKPERPSKAIFSAMKGVMDARARRAAAPAVIPPPKVRPGHRGFSA